VSASRGDEVGCLTEGDHQSEISWGMGGLDREYRENRLVDLFGPECSVGTTAR
jgi:hypothetical protein